MNDQFRTQDSRRIALVVISLLLCGAFASGLGGVGVATAQQATPTGNASSGNNTVSAPNSPNRAYENASEQNSSKSKNKIRKTLKIARKLVNMSGKESKKFIKKHPKKKKLMVEALASEGITQPKETFVSNPNGMANYLLHKTDYGGDPPERDGGLSYLPDIPSPKQIVKDVITFLSGVFTKGVQTLVSFLNWVLVTLPAPGQAMKPATWFPGFVSPMSNAAATGAGGNVSATLNGTAGNATTGIPTSPPKSLHLNKWWNAVWLMYAGLVGLLALPLFVSWIYQWSRRAQTPRERSRRMIQIAKSFGLIILGPLILPLGLHLTGMIAVGIVPSGHEFLATGNLKKLGLGVVFGAIILAIDSTIILIGVVMTFVQWVLPFFLVAAWPLAGLCLGSENEHLEPYGHSIVFGFATLLILKIIQAIWLRFLFMLPVDFSVGGLLAVVTVGIGVLLGFIYLPYYVVRSILPNVVVTMGERANEIERDDVPNRDDIPTRSDLPNREDIPSREDLPSREDIPFFGSGGDGDGGGSENGTGSTRTIGEVRERTRDRPQTNRDEVAADGGVLAQSDTGRQSRRQQQVEQARHEAGRGADHPDQTTLNTHTGNREESVELGETSVRPSDRLSETTQVRTRTDGPSGERTNTVSGNSSVGNTRSDVGPTEATGDGASTESGNGGVAAKAGTAVAVANEGRQRAKQRWNGVRRRWQETKQRLPDGFRARQRPNERGQSDGKNAGNGESTRRNLLQYLSQNGSDGSTEESSDENTGESSGQNKSQRRQFLRRQRTRNSRATGRGHESGSSTESSSSTKSPRRQALEERYGSGETNSSDGSGADSANGDSNS